MSEYLPDVYLSFRERFPDVAAATDHLGSALDDAGPLDARERRLVKLGIAVGALSDGAVRSNVRKALDEGATPEEIRHVAVLAVTTAGFPTAVAALSWVDEVLAAEV
ncbi:MAG: carboxymuconolactone decarboxylase family protein [Acidimicrobiales bacterium]|nr:carboxymuconolactone decarboxylase family protein [Acidimicrobiales bacterium]